MVHSNRKIHCTYNSKNHFSLTLRKQLSRCFWSLYLPFREEAERPLSQLLHQHLSLPNSRLLRGLARGLQKKCRLWNLPQSTSVLTTVEQTKHLWEAIQHGQAYLQFPAETHGSGHTGYAALSEGKQVLVDGQVYNRWHYRWVWRGWRCARATYLSIYFK